MIFISNILYKWLTQRTGLIKYFFYKSFRIVDKFWFAKLLSLLYFENESYKFCLYSKPKDCKTL
jgi:hypothetical protein